MTPTKSKTEPVALDPQKLPASARKELALGLAVKRLEPLTRSGSPSEALKLCNQVVNNTCGWLLEHWHSVRVDDRVRDAVADGVRLQPMKTGEASPPEMEKIRVGLNFLETHCRSVARPGMPATAFGSLRAEFGELERVYPLPLSHPRARQAMLAFEMSKCYDTITARAESAKRKAESESSARKASDRVRRIEEEAARYVDQVGGITS